MNVGNHVEYWVGWGQSGYGIIQSINIEMETAVVIDDEDGSAWTGPFDRMSHLDADQ